MRKFILYVSFLLATSTLIALLIVFVRSYTQPSLGSARISGSTSWAIVSCGGHLFWRKERLLDENWVLTSVELRGNVLSTSMDYRPPRAVAPTATNTASSGSAGTNVVSHSGGISSVALAGRHVPDWVRITYPSSTFPGFGGPAMSGAEFREVIVPYWCPILLALIFTVFLGNRVRKIRRRQRLARCGRCPMCSYDLRATPDRCPECGAGVSAAA